MFPAQKCALISVPSPKLCSDKCSLPQTLLSRVFSAQKCALTNVPTQVFSQVFSSQVFSQVFSSHTSVPPPNPACTLHSIANLDKFLDKHPKLDHPGNEVAAARQSVAELPPVQRVRIVCLGYRKCVRLE